MKVFPHLKCPVCDSGAGGCGQRCYPSMGHTASHHLGLSGPQPCHKDTRDGLLKVGVGARRNLTLCLKGSNSLMLA